ncbi:Neprilysin-2 [Aphelenchoides besseyi]|nr:Neprilysin-2 [Aphelenchoides besseyi]
MSKVWLAFIVLLVIGSIAIGVVNVVFTILTRNDVHKINDNTQNNPNTTASPVHSTTISGQVSTKPGWKDAAQQLLRGLDFSVDPCEDFYAFTCNKYLNDTPIPEGRSRIGTYDEAQQKVNDMISKALEKLDTNKATQTEILSKKIYDLCLDNAKKTENDKSKIINQQLTKDIGGIPMLTKSWTPSSLDKLLNVAGDWQSQWGIDTIASAYVTADYGNPTQYALFFGSPSLEYPLDYYIKPTYISQLEEFRQETIGLFNTFAKNIGADNSTVEEEVTKLVQFEVTLAMDMIPSDLLKNSRLQFNNYTLDELAKRYPSIGTSYFKALLKDYLQSQEIGKVDMIISEPRYFRALDSIFEDQIFDIRTFANYLSMRFLYANDGFVGGLMKERIRKIREVKFDARTTEGYDEDKLGCVSIIQGYMPYSPGYTYLKEVGKEDREKIRQNVSDQVQLTIEEFLKNVDTLQWMTPDSKKAVKNKAKNLVKNIGWPYWFDFDNPSKLDDYHKNYLEEAKDQTDYFTLLNKLATAMQKTENLGRLKLSQVDRQNFQDSPSIVNAWYEPTLNSITIPFAILNPPYYNFDWPLAYSFAGNAGSIGHELTHGFDSDGVQFGGKDDELSNCNWQFCTFLDQNSTSGFLEMAGCVISQYSEQCCPLKFGENIADLGGQLAAYNAYRRWVAESRNGVEEDRMPGLEGYTPNQIFWISYGFSWCMNQNYVSLSNQLLTNEHSPGSCRVNQVMQDIPAFAKDFGCKPKSPMFPPAEQRCKVWTGV